MTWGTKAPDWALPGVEAVAISIGNRRHPVAVTIRRVTENLIVVDAPGGQVWRFNADNLHRSGFFSTDPYLWKLYDAASPHVQDRLWQVKDEVLEEEIRELASNFYGTLEQADKILNKINEWKVQRER